MPRKGQDLLTWQEVDFVDFGGLKNAIITIDEGDGEEPRAIAVLTEYPPHQEFPAHSHKSGHVEIILEGSLQVSGRWQHPGNIRVVAPGQVYGPLCAGPEGCKAVEFFPDKNAVLATLARDSDLPKLLGDMTIEELTAKSMQLLGHSEVLSQLPGSPSDM